MEKDFIFKMSFANSLANDKFAQCFHEAYAIADKSIFGDGQVLTAYEQACLHRESLRDISTYRGFHRNTEALADATKQRKNYLVYLRDTADNALKSPEASKQRAGYELGLFLKPYRKYITGNIMKEHTRIVRLMEYDLEANELATEALELLELDSIILHLTAITNKIEKLVLERNSEVNDMDKGVSNLRNAIYTDFRKFVVLLQNSTDEAHEGYITHRKCCTDLKSLFSSYHASMALKKTKRAKSKNSSEEESKSGDVTQTSASNELPLAVSNQTAQAGSVHIANEGETADNS